MGQVWGDTDCVGRPSRNLSTKDARGRGLLPVSSGMPQAASTHADGPHLSTCEDRKGLRDDAMVLESCPVAGIK